MGTAVLWRRVRGVLGALVRERDRIWTWASLPTFGVWSLTSAPTPSMSVLPAPAQWGTYGLLILAGVLGALGSWGEQWPAYVLGHLLGTIGLLTVAGVILLRSESPVAALLAGFATVLAFNLQRAMRERRLLARVLERTEDRSEDRTEGPKT